MCDGVPGTIHGLIGRGGTWSVACARDDSDMGKVSAAFLLATSAAFLFDVCIAVRRVPLVLPMSTLLEDKSEVLQREDGATAPLMDVFQVSNPIAMPKDVPSQCQQVLMSYSFGNSYGKPFSGE